MGDIRFLAAVSTCLLALALASCTSNQADPAHRMHRGSAPIQSDVNMTHRALGPFDITMTPQANDPALSDPAIMRMALDKQYHGELEAVSKGEMLAVRTAVKGSAGYVAIERVVGTLAGRAGSFVLQHSSTMDKGVPQQSIVVVPDSGTEALTGLSGSMTIENVGGKHSYTFVYQFASADD